MVVNAFFRNADVGTLHKNSERFCAAFHPPGGLAAADALCYDKAKMFGSFIAARTDPARCAPLSARVSF